MNSQPGKFFKTTVGVRQGCLLSSILYHTSISISGRPICDLRFADDIDLMGHSNGQLQGLTNILVDIATANRMGVSTGKNKITTNGTNNISEVLA